MAKRTRISEAADGGEFQLPEAIVQHIQSYLDAKQAAQTTVLSKSWYAAWLTRPTLEFDRKNFCRFSNGKCKLLPQTAQDFSSYVNKTVKRYEDLNLKIDSLRLYLSYNRCDSVSLANELIMKAVKMGARDLDLRLRLPYSADFVVPNEVLEAESLVRLSLSDCKIDPLANGKVILSRLKCLRLVCVYIAEDTVRDLISRCPLIESLSLSCCFSLVEDNRSRTKNKELSFRDPLIGPGEQSAGSVAIGSPIKVSGFCKLNYLLLGGVYLDNSFFDGFWCKFPLLEELTLHECSYYKAVRISSHSLKFISLSNTANLRIVRVKFDVPNIRKFTYHGSKIPSVSFKSCSSNWESEVALNSWGNNHRYPRDSWFLELKRFLTKLSRSRISLKLPSFHRYKNSHMDCGKGVERLPKPTVETLMLSDIYSSVLSPAVLQGLSLSCHPKSISLTWTPNPPALGGGNNELLKSFKELIQEVHKSFFFQKKHTVGLCDLEKVNVEIRNDSYSDWKSIPWKTWLDAPQTPEDRSNIRLQFLTFTCEC